MLNVELKIISRQIKQVFVLQERTNLLEHVTKRNQIFLGLYAETV